MSHSLHLPVMAAMGSPSGYTAQPAWGFRDRTGTLWYEFNRVYGPTTRFDERAPTCRLDENLSYWAVTWPTARERWDERLAVRWISYAQARQLLGSRLTFRRFSSLEQMRPELPGLLDIGDIREEAPRANDTSSQLAPIAEWSRA